MAASIVGLPSVGDFNAGIPVVLTGRELGFAVSKDGPIMRKGHGALNLWAIHPTELTPLAKICWYVEDTPALDQLAAIGLHTESGTEGEILAISNIIATTAAGRDHPLIMAKRAAAMTEFVEIALPSLAERNPSFRVQGRPARTYNPNEVRRDREAAYWAEMGSCWVEALARRVLGREAPHYLVRSFSALRARYPVQRAA